MHLTAKPPSIALTGDRAAGAWVAGGRACAVGASKLCVVEPARWNFPRPVCGFLFSLSERSRGHTDAGACRWTPAKACRAPGRSQHDPPRRRPTSLLRPAQLPFCARAQRDALTPQQILSRCPGWGRSAGRGVHNGGARGSWAMRCIGWPQHGQVFTQAGRGGGGKGRFQSSSARMRAHFALAAGLHQP